jgi:hypothetical protein
MLVCQHAPNSIDAALSAHTDSIVEEGERQHELKGQKSKHEQEKELVGYTLQPKLSETRVNGTKEPHDELFVNGTKEPLDELFVNEAKEPNDDVFGCFDEHPSVPSTPSGFRSTPRYSCVYRYTSPPKNGAGLLGGIGI